MGVLSQMLAVVNGALQPMRLELGRVSNAVHASGFTLHRYLKADGTFDYQKYKAMQVQENHDKITWVYVLEENIAFLADYLKQTHRPSILEYVTEHGAGWSRNSFGRS